MPSSVATAGKDALLRLIFAYAAAENTKLDVELRENLPEESTLTLENKEVITGVNSIAFHLASVNPDLQLVPNEQELNADVHQWLSFTAQTSDGQELAKALDEQLTPRTYLVGNKLTVADLAAYTRIHATFSGLTVRQRFAHPALTRWFDLIQNVTPAVGGLAKLAVDIDAPKGISNAESKAREAKQAKKDQKRAELAGGSTAVTSAEETGEKVEKAKTTPKKDVEKKDKKAEKPKKEKAPKKEEAAVVAPAGAIGGCVPSQLDLRVGKIVECEKHPGADTLYVEKIECGEEEPRVVVSGLVKHVPIEEMLNRDVIIMANLKPSAMRGVKSMAMVMCATSAEGKVEIMLPPKGSKPGDRVYFEGYEDLKPEIQLNPKKKIFETLAPTLKTDGARQATWFDADGKPHLMRGDTGVCEAPTAVDALIK